MEDVEESIRAIKFLSKLDPKRYKCMLTVMRNNAVQNLPNSYPVVVPGPRSKSYRIVLLWLRSGPRTKEPKLVGRRAGDGGTKESDVVRITL